MAGYPQPVIPYARPDSTMDKTISQDRSDYHGHVFSSAQSLPPRPMPHGAIPPRSIPSPGRPSQPLAPPPPPSQIYPPRSVPAFEDPGIFTDGSETESGDEFFTESKTTRIAQRLAKQLSAKLSDLVGEEGPSGSTTSRVIDNLVSTVSQLQVENETLKQELQDIRTAQPATSEESKEIETEEAKKTPHEGTTSNVHHEPVKFVTLYRVDCSDRHGNGPPEVTYLDPPRLFKGDTSRDHFRGTIEVASETAYLESHPEVAFAIVKGYDCDIDIIRPILVEEGQRELRGQVLRQDHHLEEPEEKEIAVGPAAQAGIRAILEAFPARFPGFEHPPDFLGPDNWLTSIRFSRFRKPYLLFYLYGKKLIESLEMVDMDGSMRDSLRLLCRWMEDNFSEEWREADDLFKQGLVNSKHFGMLFRPGELVVRRGSDENGLLSGGLVPWFPSDKDLNGDTPVLYFTFNGTLSRAQLTAGMPRYFGPDQYEHDKLVDITSLTCYPVRFAPEGTKAKLITRGQRFWECRRQKLICYNEHGAESFFRAERRFMVDYAMYRRLHPDNHTLFNSMHHTYPGGMSLMPNLIEIEKPPEEFLYCLPATIHGFDFAIKTWQTLQVDNITDVTWNKTAFSQLVAPPKAKEFIQAVVSAHGKRKNMGLDIIEGKGQGLLVLLHGGPGTGKTLTAESIAEEQERPLYRVTCGDIGTEPKDVEKYLGDVLEIGRAWGCVVLLDEADVFLEERSFSDQNRNAIISIFLRILEYHDGILILTTNRTGSFDEAFKSRIQLALGYPRLNEEDREKIWGNFVDMLPRTKDRVDMEDLKGNLHKLARAEINGREIRNIITMARQLARFRKETLRYKHMQEALESAQEFTAYLKQVKGVSDDDGARADKL
ncbi:hypothetical protein BHE90_017262, partial [Fusarium euwallaceae]